MEVRHEPPSAETMFRLRAPLHVGFPDGHAVKVDDWSLKALYTSELAGRDLDGLMLSVPFQGVGVYFPIELEKGEGENEYLFRNLTGRQRETLALFYRNLLSGRMTTAADMIVALDTPVDLVPMGETEAERKAGEARVSSRRSRTLVNLAYYGTLFLLVAGFLGMVAWNRLSTVPVLSAHVAAATSQIIAPVAGYVREIPVPVGAKVQGGDILLRLDDQEALRLLTEAETARSETEQMLSATQGRLAAHAAQRAEARLTFRGGTERFDQGISVNTGDYHDIRLKLEAEANAQTAELERLTARIASLRERAEATALAAPGDGTVTDHLVRPFDMVRPGDPLVLFELDQPRSIVAHLPSSSTLKVWTGMRADIAYMRDGTRVALQGEVRRLTVDGTGANQLLVAAIDVPGLTPDESRRLFIEGMPVSVVLRPELLSRWLRSWSQ
ncbi:HlyD family secretion protein [Gemmobacter nectariphilus]|uniref:HlyD family secretion protein n=1 Tax=Gemmobacter nectariphilus TaxID=220343 RepID=UPI0004835D08|nr:biotin/lipoyl-binding protein [Gemmobacter nectariphilus]